MKTYSCNEYRELCIDAEVLSRDSFGEKVLRLSNGSMLKLFRVKRLFSSARLYPYSLRFVRNAEKLEQMRIASVRIIQLLKIPEIKRTAVQYEELAGQPLACYLKENGISRDMARELGCFIAYLHNNGIYFRSVHFNNIIVMNEQSLGLIDVSDMKISSHPIGLRKRIKNFNHFLKYDRDKALLHPELQAFISAYSDTSQLKPWQIKKVSAMILTHFQ